MNIIKLANERTKASSSTSGNEMAPIICAISKLRLLLTFNVIITICIIQSTSSLDARAWQFTRPAGGAEASSLRTSHTQRRRSSLNHQSDINSGCDLLFAHDTGALDFCQCRDSTPSFELGDLPATPSEPQSSPTNDDLSSSSRAIPISQLDCRHDNSSELLGALTRALASHLGQPKRFRINYLNIQTNVTYNKFDFEINWPKLDNNQHLAQVDQLTATLTVPENTNVSTGERFLLYLASQLFYSHRLQSLTLVINEQPPSKLTKISPLKLNNLLEKLSSLNRLEISLSSDDHASHLSIKPEACTQLELDSASLRAQSHSLKWLNLAWNNRLNLTSAPFAHLNALEYLNLESSHLGAFHLYEQFASSIVHTNLSSLNLARNELSSLERDLFCCMPPMQIGRNNKLVAHFSLPSLSQLDLSYNRLITIQMHEARAILLSFPQLANLYLQHNQIMHLNLNALFGAGWHQNSLAELKMFELDSRNSTTSASDYQQDDLIIRNQQTSKLEFIDLSHNQLVKLTVFTSNPHQGDKNKPRLRSINLAHNRLRRPLEVIPSKLVNIVIFSESFHFMAKPNTNNNTDIINLSNLGSLFDLKSNDDDDDEHPGNVTRSLCDYLSGGGINEPNESSAQDENYLAELLFDHNKLFRIELLDFAGPSCRNLETLTLSYNSIAHIVPGALNSLTRLQRLDLGENQLIEIPPGLFDNLHELQVLNLAGNKLTQLVAQLPVNLNELYLQNNALDRWQMIGSNATRLKILDLSRNQLVHLKPYVFGHHHLNELTHLNLEGNKQLKEFNWLVLFRRPASSGRGENHVQAARGQQIDLAHHQKSDKKIKKRKRVNTISDRKSSNRRRSARSSSLAQTDLEVPADYMPGRATSILDLGDNRLVVFGPSLALDGPIDCDSLTSTVKSIRVLILSRNSMKDLGDHCFTCFHQLELLDLSHNQLRTLNMKALSHLTQLRQLNVAKNYVMHVDDAHLRLSPSLRRLDFSQNQLSSLNLSFASTDKAETSELEYLNLSDNYNLKLDSSELLALLAASSSRLSELRAARIASVLTSTHVNISTNHYDLRLNSLDLGQVSRIDSNLWKFIKNGRLQVGELALCPPTRENLPLVRLIRQTKLRELDLSRCQLTSWSFKRMTQHEDLGEVAPEMKNTTNETNTMTLKKLNMSHNKLSEWPPLVGSLVRLDLSHNKFVGCLFGTQETQKSSYNASLIDLNQLEYLNLSSNAITRLCDEGKGDVDQCQQVVTRSMPLLRHLDLSHNKLETLPSGLLDQWHNLELVWLAHNQLVAPPNGGRGQHVLINSNLRLLDLTSNGQSSSSSSSSSFGHVIAPLVARQDDSNVDLQLAHTRAIPEDLIIYKEENESTVFGCSHLSDFSRRARAQGRARVHPLSSWPTSYSSEDYSDQQLSGQMDQASCSPMLRKLKLDNSTTWPGLDLEVTSSPVALSLIGNQIDTIAQVNVKLTTRLRVCVVHLDLSRNAIGSPSPFALDEICTYFPNLQTLEMAHQSNLQEVSLQFRAGNLQNNPLASQTCTKLAYVNLSHNKLRSIHARFEPLNSLVALRLDHNQLQDFGPDLLAALPNLRYLDLRFNQIAQPVAVDITALALLSHPLLDLETLNEPEVPPVRFGIQATRKLDTLRITHKANQTFGLEVSSLASPRSVSSTQLADQSSHVVRFCTLSRAEVYKVCIKKSTSLVTRPAASGLLCFGLKPPPHGPSCTTNIANSQNQQGNDNDSTKIRTESLLMSSDQARNKSYTQEADGHQDDPVLSFIDQLKWAWLRAKQFDLATYLAQVSKVKHDSVLMTINGRHPIYTLTVIKFGLVLAAVCVILLSITMFALLTATVMSGSGAISSKRQKLRRQNKVSDGLETASYDQVTSRTDSGKGDDETTTTSGGSGGGSSTSCTKSHDTSEGNSRCSRITTSHSGGSSHSDGVSSNLLNTVREVNLSMHGQSINSNGPICNQQQQHHHQQHHQFIQNCSTPSSSLAPSSVETGETMQAVDSLQSCSFTRSQRQEIYNSQRTLTAADGHAHFNSVDQYQQQQQQQQQAPAGAGAQVQLAPTVATVMRMVKSSTFDGTGAGFECPPPSISGYALDTQQTKRDYGTLRQMGQFNPANGGGGGGGGYNYSSLARPPPAPPLRASNAMLPPEQRRQVYLPAQSMFARGGSGGGPPSELDPATLSLLSLNSQLSASGGGGGAGCQSANNNSGQLASEQVSAVSATSLCQYHTRQQAMQRARDHHHHAQDNLVLVSDDLHHHQHHSTGADNGTLFELDEELQLADWAEPGEPCEADYQVAPPPPPSL